MSADDYKTLREVGVAMEGVSQQFGLLKWVLGGSVAVGVAVSGFFYSKLDNVEKATVEIKATLAGIQKTLDEISTASHQTNSALGTIKKALTSGPQPASPAMVAADEALRHLKGLGFQVFNASDLQGAPDFSTLPAGMDEVFVFTPNTELQRAFEKYKEKHTPDRGGSNEPMETPQ